MLSAFSLGVTVTLLTGVGVSGEPGGAAITGDERSSGEVRGQAFKHTTSLWKGDNFTDKHNLLCVMDERP